VLSLTGRAAVSPDGVLTTSPDRRTARSIRVIAGVAEHPIAFRALSDVVRVGAAVSAVAALVGIPSVGLGTRFLLVLLVLMIPRATGGVPAPLDLAFTVTLLAAVWMSTAEWYDAGPVSWLVHVVAAGVTAVVLHLVLARTGVLPAPDGWSWAERTRVVARTVGIGVVVGGVWEAYRWLEPVVVSLAAHTSADLVVHMLGNTVGALVAGLALAAVGRGSNAPPAGAATSPTAVGDRLRSIL